MCLHCASAAKIANSRVSKRESAIDAAATSSIEDYVAQFHGEPLGCVVLVKRNASGQTQHVVASYRLRTSVVHFARLLAEKFAGTPIADHFGPASP